MYPNYSKTFLDLEDVLIRKVVHADSFLQIHIETRPAEQTCPCCSQKTRRIHDYRFQKIQDIPNLGKQVTLILKKRRGGPCRWRAPFGTLGPGCSGADECGGQLFAGAYAG